MDNNFYIVADESKHQKEFGDAIECGMKLFKIKCVRVKNSWLIPHTARFICTWGWRRGPKLRDAGKQVLVIERGFIDRMKYGALMMNGLNGFADFGNVKVDPKRFDFKNKLKKWKGDKNLKLRKPVLVLGQTPNDCSLRGKNLDKWYESMAQAVIDKYNLPVIFRPHPNVILRGLDAEYSNMTTDRETDLKDLLDECSFAITFNSNSAVDCLLNGTQVIVFDKGSVAYDICPNNFYQLNFDEPDRLKFFQELSSKQFTPEEISKGKGIEHFLENFSELIND